MGKSKVSKIVNERRKKTNEMVSRDVNFIEDMDWGENSGNGGNLTSHYMGKCSKLISAENALHCFATTIDVNGCDQSFCSSDVRWQGLPFGPANGEFRQLSWLTHCSPYLKRICPLVFVYILLILLMNSPALSHIRQSLYYKREPLR